MFHLLRPILFPNLLLFYGLCSSTIPRYFLDFASDDKIIKVTNLNSKKIQRKHNRENTDGCSKSGKNIDKFGKRIGLNK